MKRLDRQLAGVTTERHHDGLAGDIFVTAASRPRGDGTASRNVANAAANCRCALGSAAAGDSARAGSRPRLRARHHREYSVFATQHTAQRQPCA
jgi:hypothetical protein